MKIKPGDIVVIKCGQHPKVCLVNKIMSLGKSIEVFEEIEQTFKKKDDKVLEVTVLFNGHTGRKLNKKQYIYNSCFAISLERYLDEQRAVIGLLEKYL